MDKLCTCNTGSDDISIISLNSLEEDRIVIPCGREKIGPHSITYYENSLIIANKYQASISKINLENENVLESYPIGTPVNDVKVYKDTAYIICGEANSLITFDLISLRIREYIHCGIFPYSIDISEERNLALITNMLGDSLCLIDCSRNDIVKFIQVKDYPTKSIFAPEGNGIYVCESNMGTDKGGMVKHIDISTGETITETRVGSYPIDICSDNEGNIYVTNFNDGSISIIDCKEMKEVERIMVGGMPRGIIKHKEDLFIGDNLKNVVLKYNMKNRKIKTIPVGIEPNGMIIV